MPLQGLELQARGVGHVLRDRQLSVPAYQRPYAWTLDNVQDFWNDLLAAQARGDLAYFLGAIVLARPGDSSGREQVIDGQQRLATSSLLLAALRDAFLAAGDGARADVVAKRYLVFEDLVRGEPLPRLQLNEKDGPFFDELVIQRRYPEPRTPSHHRIREAYKFLIDAVSAEVGEVERTTEVVDRWIRFLDSAVQVFVVEVPTEADAFLIFETLNDRGAPLTIADLLKTYLLSHSESHFNDVESAWSLAVEALSDVTIEPADLADFLRHYWSSLHASTRERDLYRAIRDTLATPSEVVEFALALPRAAELYAAILDSSHPWWAEEPPESAEYMSLLQRLGLAQNRPLLLALLEHFESDALARALQMLVSWSVRGLVVGGIGGGRTERAYALAAAAARNGRVADVGSLYDALRPIIPGDDDFRTAFEVAVVPRARVADYMLKALESRLRGEDRPSAVDLQVETTAFLQPVMPAHAAPAGWEGFAPEDIPTWTRRIGNYVLLDRPRRPRAPTWDEFVRVAADQPFEITRHIITHEIWRPSSIRSRQTALADVALQVWPRDPVML